MRKSLSVARAVIRGGIELRIVRIALAVAAVLPSVPALAQRHEEDRRPQDAAWKEVSRRTDLS